MYHKTKDHKVVGSFMFSKPSLMVNDLDLAKQMFIKDFDHFMDRRSMTLGHEYLDNMLFFMAGEPWKELRSIISPIFTSGKLKSMYKLFNKIGTDFSDHVGTLSESREDVNARDLASKYTLQVIASTGFGIDIAVYRDDAESERFRKMTDKLSGKGVGALGMLKILLAFILPSLSKALKIETFDKESVNYFGDIIKQTINSRKGQTQKRNDMVDLLLDALQNTDAENEEVKKQIEQELEVSRPMKVSAIPRDKVEAILISNLIMLFFAGMDTSSAILAVLMYCMAKNPVVQEQLYDEIKDALGQSDDGELDYNTIQTLPYLDMVVNEALRFYPLGDHERKCVKDYTLPGTSFTIPKGMMVYMPATGIMSDARYFPNPEQFNPENFSKENKEKRNPYAFMPFGIGPRNCIGYRLALLNLKSGLVHLLSGFKVLTCDKTPEELIVHPTSGNIDVKGGIWVMFEKRM